MDIRSKALLGGMLIAPAVAAIMVTSPGLAEPNAAPDVLKGGEMIFCPDGYGVQSRYTQTGENFEVVGILGDGPMGRITVAGPQGDIVATPTVNLVTTGDPQPGEPARMKGAIAATGDVVAIEIADICPGTEPTATPFPEIPPPALDVAEQAEATEGDEDGGSNGRGVGHDHHEEKDEGERIGHQRHGDGGEDKDEDDEKDKDEKDD